MQFVYLGNHRVAILTGQMNAGEVPGWCFIATAVYGTSMAPDVEALREFRDKVLKRLVLGEGSATYLSLFVIQRSD